MELDLSTYMAVERKATRLGAKGTKSTTTSGSRNGSCPVFGSSRLGSTGG